MGLSRSTIYNKLNPKSKSYDPDFPKPLRLGSSSVGWLLSSVHQWLTSRIQ
ncbi:helix-turn-helix transcriptional regulator [Aeromonas caviae]|uniref:helix-turn-helix transcriptional regulator n=1 Tax=Aeromonas caviae TaxID=648 RepID=UPI002448D114|nr:AlpA family phage regulatory protein [Aeromonas caviae]MDH1451994.1 AlpA family phage regulatory protein [Aeromonas caviae]MDH1456135.1 AlpA family phage regulatory protein [Aeromonas caviae]